ncbi:hypothetical protein Rhe02_80300 [Rhizocola hellebori]|uniref:Uncharacterized protein n=1 Tax=Rhizocola hellebori TaxID=1392758 RepID=A0A8J3QFI1_9ACTN|nr:hypothetical protein [Rhizocola hellebori]GIH09963.1 hypothetical protein Rhe02_80300 [Rhizocola hellebori]
MDDLRQVTQILLNQVSHWTQARWGNRGEALHQALQRIAGPEHTLPRLSDLVLPDQLRVVVSDLLESNAGPAEVSRAVEELTEIRGALRASQ